MNLVSWNGEEWSAALELPSWRAFTYTVPEGQVEVVFLDANAEQPPDARRLSVLSYLIETQVEACEHITKAMRAYYDQMRRQHLEFQEKPDSTMPANPSVGEFSLLHELLFLYVHDRHRNGQPYVGYQFRALWNTEHGLGVLTNGLRVVEVGDADTAFLGGKGKP